MIIMERFKAGSAALLLVALLALPCYGADSGKQVMHAKPWAFGQSESRKDVIWKRGLDAKNVEKKKSPASHSHAANTSGGVNSALQNAGREKVKGTLGVSMGHESSTWKVTPEQQHPDETVFRDRRHIVRGYANMKAGDDLNISVGPELILKDEQHGEEAATENQPDSALGLGMRFKYDF